MRLNPKYWDCECEHHFIHAKADSSKCSICGAVEEDQPTSRQDEIEEGDAFFIESHTPGPWAVFLQNGIPGHCVMAQIFGPDGKSLVGIEPTDNSTKANANVRLIGAAPVLLEIVRTLSHVPDYYTEIGPEMAKLCQLAKETIEIIDGVDESSSQEPEADEDPRSSGHGNSLSNGGY